MASDEPAAEWYRRPPSAFDIVTCYFPEADPPPDGSTKLRPALVLSVLRESTSGKIALRIAYGTSVLKLLQREHLDLIIQNATDLRLVGLPRATRFDLDNTVVMPWCPPYFEAWPGYGTPVIGTLTEDYAKELAWLMLKREQPQ